MLKLYHALQARRSMWTEQSNRGAVGPQSIEHTASGRGAVLASGIFGGGKGAGIGPASRRGRAMSYCIPRAQNTFSSGQEMLIRTTYRAGADHSRIRRRSKDVWIFNRQLWQGPLALSAYWRLVPQRGHRPRVKKRQRLHQRISTAANE